MRPILKKLTNHWTNALALIVCILLALYAYACQSTCKSMLTPSQRITRPELMAEIDYLLEIGKARVTELDEQDAWKKAVFDQFMIADAQGKPNPAGIIGLLFGIGGVTAIINRVKLQATLNNKNPSNANGTKKDK
jgi:hypothetical protein